MFSIKQILRDHLCVIFQIQRLLSFGTTFLLLHITRFSFLFLQEFILQLINVWFCGSRGASGWLLSVCHRYAKSLLIAFLLPFVSLFFLRQVFSWRLKLLELGVDSLLLLNFLLFMLLFIRLLLDLILGEKVLTRQHFVVFFPEKLLWWERRVFLLLLYD